MATPSSSLDQVADTTSQQRFLSLLKQDILKLDAAELDFGIYRILNYRRTQVLAYLDESLPQRISQWATAPLIASARRQQPRWCASWQRPR